MFVINCGQTYIFFKLLFFNNKNTFKGNVFWGVERDDVDDGNDTNIRELYYYSKEFANWIINWPGDTASLC